MNGYQKPKVGIAFFVANWYEELFLGGDEKSKKFKRQLDEDKNKIINKMKDNFTIISSDYITSRDKAKKAALQFLSEDVDLVIVCYIVWGEDELVIPIIHKLAHKPILLWNYYPYHKMPRKNSAFDLLYEIGPIGTTQAMSVFVKMNKKIFLVTGDINDDKAIYRIRKIAMAAKIREDLREARFGVLPYRDDVMICTYIDEFRLLTKIGPYIKYISVKEFKDICDKVPHEKTVDFVNEIKNNLKIDKDITEENLLNSAQASLGLELLMKEYKLDALAIDDINVELLKALGLRPNLYTNNFAKTNIVVGIEGDIGCTTAMYILNMFTNRPSMMSEIYLFNRKDNVIIAGHAGLININLCENKRNVTVTPDFEFNDATLDLLGVWTQFKVRPGKVTLLNFYCTNDDFQFMIMTGTSLGGDLNVEGYPHIEIKLDAKIDEMFNTFSEHGVSHHWAIVHGDVKEELGYLADMLDIKKVVLSNS